MNLNEKWGREDVGLGKRKAYDQNYVWKEFKSIKKLKKNEMLRWVFWDYFVFCLSDEL